MIENIIVKIVGHYMLFSEKKLYERIGTSNKCKQENA